MSDLTRDITTIFTGQKNLGGSYLRGSPRTPHRAILPKLCNVVKSSRNQRCPERTWSHRIDTDSFLDKHGRQRPGEAQDCPFCAGIIQQMSASPKCGNRCGVDYGSTLFQIFFRSPDYVEIGVNIGFKSFDELGTGNPLYVVFRKLHGSIIHDDVQAAKSLMTLLHARFTEFLTSQIGPDHQAISAFLLHHLSSLFCIFIFFQINYSNPCPFPGKMNGHAATDSTIPSDDQNDFTFQLATSMVILPINFRLRTYFTDVTGLILFLSRKFIWSCHQSVAAFAFSLSLLSASSVSKSSA